MDIAKEIKAIRSEAEKEWGRPLLEGFWEVIEKALGNTSQDFDGDPAGREEYVDEYRGITESYVIALKSALLSVKELTSIDGSGEPSKPRKIYRKCYERRFYLVDFVVNNGLNVKNNRIDWKRTVEAWNESHPSDMMSLPVLKAEYYHARREEPLMLQYFITRVLKVAEEWK